MCDILFTLTPVGVEFFVFEDEHYIIPDFKPNFSKYYDYTFENLLPEIPLCKTSCLKFHSVKPLA